MDYSYLNQAGFDPSSAMSTLSSAAAASVSEANFYSDLSGSCPSTAAMTMGNYGSLGSRYHSSVMQRYGPNPTGSMPTPSGSPGSSCGVLPGARSQPEHHRQSMFGAAGMGLNCKNFLRFYQVWDIFSWFLTPSLGFWNQIWHNFAHY